MWETYQRYRALDAETRRTFRRAVILLPLIGVSLRVRGYKKTQDYLQRRLDGHSAPEVEQGCDAEKLQNTCRMVRAAVHHGLGHPTCLEESLTLWYLLRGQGTPASVRIGVRKLAQKFEAHAWVEWRGAALNQAEEMHHHYAAFEGEFSAVRKDQQ
jgi:hypothetical protein